MKWLQRLRHKKVKYLFASYDSNNQGKAFIRDATITLKDAAVIDEDEHPDHGQEKIDIQNPMNELTGEPLKPSEIILQSQQAGDSKAAAEVSDDERDLVNEDRDYCGPFSVITASVESTEEANIRIIRVYEEDIQHQVCSLKNLSSSMASS
jgi:hypothetical protein